MGDHITKDLADFTVNTAFTDLPDAVIKKAKLILLDSIGCALGGSITDRSRIALELVSELGGKPQATILGKGKSSYALAAFANGELINALDFDATGPLTPHVAPYALPPALAAGERMHASGKDLITAIALGHEIGGRLASSVASFTIPKEEPPYYEWAPRYSFTTASFGAVAAAGKILGLSSEQMANAFGIVGVSTPVPAGVKGQHTGGPAVMIKYHCWSGWIAQLATVAALAAGRGFTGDTTILDGEWGFWKIYGSPFFKVDNLMGGLGKVWHVPGVWFKAFPSCGLNHAGIDGVNRIIQENGIDPDDIEEIIYRGSPNLLTASRSQREIKNSEDAQFSPAFAMVLAAYYGRKPSPAWLLPATFKDHKMQELMKKVRIEVHPKAEEVINDATKKGRLQGFFGSSIEISAGGRRFVTEVANAKGTPGNLLTDDELAEKFRVNADFSAIRSDKVEKAIEMIINLEETGDIGQLMKLLSIDDT